MRLHQHGRLDEAEAKYRQVLQTDPDHRQALRLSGILARERGEFGVSLARLERLAELCGVDPAILCEIGLTRMMAGELAVANRCFRQALAADPNAHKAIANLGALLQRRGHVAEAIDMYRRCLEIDAGDLEVRCNLASALLEVGRGEDALAECDEALAMSADNPMLLAVQGGVLCGLEKFDRGVTVLEPVVSAGVLDEMAMINLAFAWHRLGEAGTAADILGRCIAVFPDSARAVADLAGVRLALGQIDAALACCETFLARCPGDRSVTAVYAYVLRDAGRMEEADAILDFDRLIRLRDVNAPAGYVSLVEFNSRLATYVKGHPSLLPNPVRKATTGGAQSGELDGSDNPEIAILEEWINDFVAETITDYQNSGLRDHVAMLPATDRWTLRIWATVLQAGGRQTPHFHPGAWLSGVYYLQLPADLGTAGGLEFGAPPSHLSVKSMPNVFPLTPREGRLVLFPSYLYHGTQTFDSRQSRISMAFDVVPKAD